MKSNEAELTPAQFDVIRKNALKTLQSASAAGRFPTPISDIVKNANLVVADKNVFSEGFLSSLTRKITGTLKRALSKVIGLFDPHAKMIYIDSNCVEGKRNFLKLHETGHAVIPHQRDLFGLFEDCEKTLSPDVSDLFDREANVFASEVLFQLDGFSEEARGSTFGIKVPLELAKKYGASVYAAVRQYVFKHHLPCCVLVLEPPAASSDGITQASKLRRSVTSKSFDDIMGSMAWPLAFTINDVIGQMVPLDGKKMSRPRTLPLRSSDGTHYDCVAEAFRNPFYTFILIHMKERLQRKIITPPI